MFRLEIKTGGAAFQDAETGKPCKFAEAQEIIRILREIEQELVMGESSGILIDINGNKVGSWSR